MFLSQEELQSVVQQLTGELHLIRTAHKQHMLELEEKLSPQSCGQTSNTQEELTQCRRSSCGDIQQYLQTGLKALEDRCAARLLIRKIGGLQATNLNVLHVPSRFEPILVALLKRRDAAAGALVKAKEQAQELRAQLRPLKEESQELKLKRACLEEKLTLIGMQGREDVQRYKVSAAAGGKSTWIESAPFQDVHSLQETVYHLEECTRELKTQVKLQKLKTKEMEETRDSLAKQLHLYR